ncbi:MAG: glycosyltransferase family 4 protein, partial [Bacteroides sp.]|nr:glycosyltransferase family 4 protein [Bacteroides sp.]
MKIAYCLNSIRYLGGIQKVTIVKANALSEIPENEVYIIVTDNKEGVLLEPLSPKVKLIDLDINYYEDDYKSRWNVLKGIFIKRREHKKRLTS